MQFRVESASHNVASYREIAAIYSFWQSDFFASGAGIFSSKLGNVYMLSQNTEASLKGAMEDGDYFSFSVTVDADYQIDMEKFAYQYAISLADNFAYTGNVQVLMSDDGFVTSTDVMATTMSRTKNGQSSFARYLDTSARVLTGTTEFRIYGWDNSDYNSTDDTGYQLLRLDNIKMEGTVSAIPEPETIGMLGLGVLITMFIRRKLTV